MDLEGWVDRDKSGWLHHPGAPADWANLLHQYGGAYPIPLEQVFRVVRASRCRTVIVENRYVDRDFRSEYAAFWAGRFDSTPAFARRLHFFTREIDERRLHNLPSDSGYLGYSVIRPVRFGSVGRTIIRRPPALRRAVMVEVDDEVTLFGNRLTVRGAPFVQQDREYLRCAHAAGWVCHYVAAKRGLVGRRDTAAFEAESPASLQPDRRLPSKGMNPNQLQTVFGALGQPALLYGLSTMPEVNGVPTPAADPTRPPGLWDTRLFSVICRYLNSGFPVLIGTTNHAFVLVGWYRDRRGRIVFVANDDQIGPYEVVPSPFTDHRAPWWSIMIPLPPKVFLSGEMSEHWAHYLLRLFGGPVGAPTNWAAIANGVTTDVISLRAYLCEGSDYKLRLADRSVGRPVLQALRMARLPHFVWVVEAQDRKRRDDGEVDTVVAEILFDSTSHEARPRIDAVLLPPVLTLFPPDRAKPLRLPANRQRWRSSIPIAA